MKEIKSKKNLIIFVSLLICLVFLFFALAVMVMNNKTTSLDNFFIQISEKIRNNLLTGFVKFITYFGSVYMLTLLAAVGIVFARKNLSKIILCSGVVISALASVVAKYIFRRERPSGIALIHETGFSFPSAHSMLSMVFYGILIVLILRSSRFKLWQKIAFSCVLELLIVLVGLSRVYLGVHFITDVLAGWIIGFIFIVLTIIIFDFIQKRTKKEPK